MSTSTARSLKDHIMATFAVSICCGMTIKGCSPHDCACEECLHRSALPTIVYFSYAVILRPTAGQNSGKGSSGQLRHLQTKQSNHPSSALPTRQPVPVVRPLEYELLKINPTLQNNSHIVNFVSAYTCNLPKKNLKSFCSHNPLLPYRLGIFAAQTNCAASLLPLFV